MKIHVATDHAGFFHKNAIMTWLQKEGYTVIDHGAGEFHELDDFPDFISIAAKAVSESGGKELGIIFGGSGQGEAMMANRFPHVRAVVYYGKDKIIPALSRQHNDSNVISIGARFVTEDEAKEVIWEWLHTEPLTDDKYERRNNKIEMITRDFYD